MITKALKSKLFKIAHLLIKKAEVKSFSEALRKAWKAIKIYAGMLTGKVEFRFMKLDGSVRNAVGTLHDIDYTPSPNAKPRQAPDEDVMRYFDLEKNQFRSFRVASLI